MSQLKPAKEISKKEFLIKAGRFRILVIGRANAGKTSILQKVCNATEGEEPEIYNQYGRRINLDVVGPSVKRGEHDINNEMIFRSNPGFIFHDSFGFEAGSVDEFREVQGFIQGHANETSLRKRLHVIWYCIPVSDARLVTRAEEIFFSECDTKGVPVLVLFTKFDSLDFKAFSAILRENPSMNPNDATHQAPVHAKADFDRVKANLSIFQSKYPPKAYLYLYDMHKPNTACYDLLDQTAGVLDNFVLQALFLSTQKSSLALKTKYTMRTIAQLATGIPVERMLKLILFMFQEAKEIPFINCIHC
ncbi:hypothetical protein Hypma_010557 [Hypsizygus marmoreus]|uniref:G domain-containing protein n=1 Tax=Hypsizygus marmoreus TaxID=39966 RepID=A0A369JJI4_HYPMA|nr:hypothetical protein Hypma_010557 [Hypsizygus marmoreus]